MLHKDVYRFDEIKLRIYTPVLSQTLSLHRHQHFSIAKLTTVVYFAFTLNGTMSLADFEFIIHLTMQET